MTPLSIFIKKAVSMQHWDGFFDENTEGVILSNSYF
jgi:hypothetical protein